MNLEWSETIDLMNEELFSFIHLGIKPNTTKLINMFLPVLISVYNHIEEKSPNFIHQTECQCFGYINDSLILKSTIEKIDEMIQTHIPINIHTNQYSCYLVQMMDKYKLIHHMLIRNLISI